MRERIKRFIRGIIGKNRAFPGKRVRHHSLVVASIITLDDWKAIEEQAENDMRKDEDENRDRDNDKEPSRRT